MQSANPMSLMTLGMDGSPLSRGSIQRTLESSQSNRVLGKKRGAWTWGSLPIPSGWSREEFWKQDR